MALERGEQRVGAEDEDARVPGVAWILQVALRGLRVRLLDESVDRVHARFPPAAPPQVSVPRLGTGRRNADGDQIPALRHPCRGLQRVAEALRMGDVMIAGKDQEDSLPIFLQHPHRGEADRRRGVARCRLDQEICRGQIGNRLAHAPLVVAPAHHPDASRRTERRDARIGLRQQAAAGDQLEELLRPVRA